MKQTHDALIVGWDIGGAHLKATLLNADGELLKVVQLPCPVWQGLSVLKQSLHQALRLLEIKQAHHAVTMTAELVDLFASRQQGVIQICAVLQDILPAAQLFTEHGFLSLSQAATFAPQIASANWLASGLWLARHIPQLLLLDIGSTTTDLIWLKDGRVMSQGRDDASRLQLDELIYTGVVRTPLMALCQRVMWQASSTNVAAEYFATTADIYRLTGDLPRDEDVAPTADGQDKSWSSSARRLLRMVGAELEAGMSEQVLALAQAFQQAQLSLLQAALQRFQQRNAIAHDVPFAAAGVGRFLLARVAGQHSCLSISEFIPTTNASLQQQALLCLPAFAVARLWQLKR